MTKKSNRTKQGYVGDHMKFFMSVFFLTVFSIVLAAQEAQHKIESLVRVKNDTVVLRWIPSTIPAWQAGNKYGYVIQRYAVAKNDKEWSAVATGVPAGVSAIKGCIKISHGTCCAQNLSVYQRV